MVAQAARTYKNPRRVHQPKSTGRARDCPGKMIPIHMLKRGPSRAVVDVVVTVVVVVVSDKNVSPRAARARRTRRVKKVRF